MPGGVAIYGAVRRIPGCVVDPRQLEYIAVHRRVVAAGVGKKNRIIG